jgi:hypothetical protein
VRSFSKSDRFVVGTAALFLAAKARDELRPLDAVLAACLRVRAAQGGGGKKGGGGGGDGDGGGGGGKKDVPVAALLADPAYMASLRDAVLTAERGLLYALGFELDLEPPHDALLRSLSLLQKSDDAAVAAFWADPKHTQLALNFISDSFRTTLCLTHDWAAIGCGAVAAVVSITGGPPPLVAGGAPVWQAAAPDLTQETVDDVVSVITGMYTTDGGGGGGGKAKERRGDDGAGARQAKAAKTGAGDKGAAPPLPDADGPPLSPASGEAASTPLGYGAAASAPPPHANGNGAAAAADAAPTAGLASVVSLEEGELA